MTNYTHNGATPFTTRTLDLASLPLRLPVAVSASASASSSALAALDLPFDRLLLDLALPLALDPLVDLPLALDPLDDLFLPLPRRAPPSCSRSGRGGGTGAAGMSSERVMMGRR